MAHMTAQLAGSSSERLCHAVCGRVVPELDAGPPASKLRRTLGGLRYVGYLLGAARHKKLLQQLVQNLVIQDSGDAYTRFCAIDAALPSLDQAYDHHMTASALSGALTPILLEITSGGTPPTSEHHAQVAALLSGTDDVESTDIALGADRIVDALLALGPRAEAFCSLSAEAAHAWLNEANRHLGNKTPIEAAETDLGARQVEEILFRAIYGLPA